MKAKPANYPITMYPYSLNQKPISRLSTSLVD